MAQHEQPDVVLPPKPLGAVSTAAPRSVEPVPAAPPAPQLVPMPAVASEEQPETHVSFANMDMVVDVERHRTGRPPRAREASQEARAGHDAWARSVVNWDEGHYKADIRRVWPKTFPIAGRQHNVKGYLGALRGPPTYDAIEEQFGGGDFIVEITGPDPVDDTVSKKIAERSVDVGGDPKVLGGVGLDGNPVNYGSGVDTRRSGDSVGEVVIGKALDVIARSADSAQARADRATADRDNSAVPLTQQILQTAEKLGDAKADAERVRAEMAERQVERMQSQMDRLAQQIESLRNGHGNGAPVPSPGSELAAAMSGLSSVLTALRPDSPAAAAAATPAVDREFIRNLEDRYTREAKEAREAAAERERALRDAHQQDVAAREDRHRERLEAMDARHREMLESVRENERNAAMARESAKQNRIDSLEAQLTTLRADLTEARAEARDNNREVQRLSTQLAEAKAELKARPAREPQTFVEQIKAIKEQQTAIELVSGGGKRRRDDDDDDEVVEERKPTVVETIRDVAEIPLVSNFAAGIWGLVTGEAEKNRKAQIEIEKARADAAKAAAVEAYSKRKKARQANAGLGGAAPASEPEAASDDTPKRLAAMQDDDPPVPDRVSNPKLSAKAEPLRPLLVAIDQAIRADATPQGFFEHYKANVPTIKRFVVEPYKTPDKFLSALETEGALVGFPLLAHPAGRRWVKHLWQLVK